MRTADFASAGGASVRLGGLDAAAIVRASGRFELEVPGGIPNGGELSIELPGYLTAVLPAGSPRELRTILLVPQRWSIRTGAHAGEVVAIDLVGATRTVCAGCSSFYGKVAGNGRSGISPGIPTWPPSAFPLEVAFDPEVGARISAADSASFWRVVQAIEEQFGLRLFKPAPLSTVLANVANDGPGSLLVTVDPRLPNAGWGSFIARSGDILSGAVHFRSAHTFARSASPEVPAHEIVHALGFGHTCAWRSVVADVRRCRGNHAPLPTAEDVAHAQLLWRIRDLEREAGISNTVDAALAGVGHTRDHGLQAGAETPIGIRAGRQN